MTKDEALAVFERHEIPHRFVETGQAKELFPALKVAGDALATEVRRLERDLAAARAEAARLREAAQAIIIYSTEGAPTFCDWEAKFDALKAALEGEAAFRPAITGQATQDEAWLVSEARKRVDR